MLLQDLGPLFFEMVGSVELLIKEDSQILHDADPFQSSSFPENGGSSSKITQQQKVRFFDGNFQPVLIRPGLEGRKGLRRQTTQRSFTVCGGNDEEIICESLNLSAWGLMETQSLVRHQVP
ncbi:hypothetical protein AVEN_106199-1 [Araneus ventricosus]|uniref:Uncharacterized protein n=1 Tax=Araneus ventricosus TaxID=182803 RepID=A0A4Y2QTW4_ARAVE|nr:hypothetical protein AVEN_232200-1 [Araneus ventricosus]GBN66668.1 hypothetical protein AVEN_106199-1 [Araneus ventricosus]